MAKGWASSGTEGINYAKRPAIKRRSAARRRLFSCVCIVFLLAVAVAPSRHIWRLHQERTVLQEELATLEAQNSVLQRQVTNMESSQWVEQAAREKLGLVKPGEIVYIPIQEQNH